MKVRVSPLLAVLTVLLSSCESPLELVFEEVERTAPSEQPPPVRLGDFDVEASAGAWRFELEPYLTVQASARNAAPAPRAAEGVCVAQVRVREPATGTLVWSGPAAPVESCPPPRIDLADILPGRTFEFADHEWWTPVEDVLAGGHPEGDYAVALLVRAGADTAEVAAGRVRLSLDTRPAVADPRVLRYRTSTTVEGPAPSVVTRVQATNPTDRWVDLASGACFMHVRAFDDASRTGVPIWRSDAVSRPCAAVLLRYSVPPGGTLGPEGFTRSTPVVEILGDALPEGRYWFSVRLEFARDNPEGGSIDQPIEIPAGSAVLRKASTASPISSGASSATK